MSGAAWLSIIAGSATPNPLNRKPENVKSLPQVARLGWRTTRALRRDRNVEVGAAEIGETRAASTVVTLTEDRGFESGSLQRRESVSRPHPPAKVENIPAFCAGQRGWLGDRLVCEGPPSVSPVSMM
jgi:hypothetical protein